MSRRALNRSPCPSPFVVVIEYDDLEPPARAGIAKIEPLLLLLMARTAPRMAADGMRHGVRVSTARQQYHAAAERCGRSTSPNAINSRGFGSWSNRWMRAQPLRTP